MFSTTTASEDVDVGLYSLTVVLDWDLVGFVPLTKDALVEDRLRVCTGRACSRVTKESVTGSPVGYEGLATEALKVVPALG